MVTKRYKLRKKRISSTQNVVFFMVLVMSFLSIGGFLAYHNINIHQKRAELLGRIEGLHSQIGELARQKEIIEAGLLESQTPEYQERVLREQGLYQKQGEEVITILSPEIQESRQTSGQKTKEERVWWNPFSWFSRD